jgi:hypothetical protein
MLPDDYPADAPSVNKPHKVNVTIASLDIPLSSSSTDLTNCSYVLLSRHATAHSTLTSESLSSEIQPNIPLLSGLNRNGLWLKDAIRGSPTSTSPSQIVDISKIYAFLSQVLLKLIVYTLKVP